MQNENVNDNEVPAVIRSGGISFVFDAISYGTFIVQEALCPILSGKMEFLWKIKW